MTAVSKNIYFHVLDYIVDKYHNSIQKKCIDVKSNSFAEYNVDSNAKGPKFKIGDQVRISKYKTFLLKNMLLICQKRFL